MSLVGQNKTYESSALAIISFALTWIFMGLLNASAMRREGQSEIMGAHALIWYVLQPLGPVSDRAYALGPVSDRAPPFSSMVVHPAHGCLICDVSHMSF